MVHELSFPGVSHACDDACAEGSSCASEYVTEVSRRGFVCELEIARKENGNGQEWDPTRRARVRW